MHSTILIVVLILAILSALPPWYPIRNLRRLLNDGNPFNAGEIDPKVNPADQNTTDAGRTALQNEVSSSADIVEIRSRGLPSKPLKSGALMLDSAGVDDLMGKDNQNWVSDFTEGDCMRM